MLMKSSNLDLRESGKRWLDSRLASIGLKKVSRSAAQEAPGETSTLNILSRIPLYAPNSGGTYDDRAAVTIRTANRIFPAFGELIRNVAKDRLSVINAEVFPRNAAETEAAEALKASLDACGSDKANRHKYHCLYGPILKNRNAIRGILEIGIGTTFMDVVSTMGAQGTPGASLRAFRDFLPNAQIYGADIDRRILFQEERISTYYVDQTDPAAMKNLADQTPNDLDLIIDDGLHSPDANIAVLTFAIRKVRIGGWVVIEDIREKALPVWDVVAALLPTTFDCVMVKNGDANAFAVERTG
jgi:hypothetical protein